MTAAERQRKMRDKDPEKTARQRKKHNLSRYGINVEQYDQMLLDQGGVCLSCSKTCVTGQPLSVDHCHETGKIRGLLCRKCNSALGLLNDDPELVNRALLYLTN
jgi:hypothetical protein